MAKSEKQSCRDAGKEKDHHWGRGGEAAKTPGPEKVTYTGSVPGRT